MTTSHASAVWEGKFKDGKGSFKAGSGAFSAPYTAATRFEGAKGTNPEELIAAAHAACFSMALAADLEKAGTPPSRIATSAACTIEIIGGAPRITRIELTTKATVPGVDEAAFRSAAEGAKKGCPVSKALAGNVDISLDAKLE
jgi:osmotically inducible protein OsmC